MENKPKRKIKPWKGERNWNVNVRQTKEEHAAFVQLARKRGMSQADCLAYLVRKEVEGEER